MGNEKETDIIESDASNEGVMLSVVVPVYNEVATIRKVVERIEAVDINKEVIIIDDGSVDGTGETLRELNGRFKSIKVFSNGRNLGKGAAVRRGIGLSRGEYIVIQDADLEYDPQMYKSMIERLSEDGVDAIFGSRIIGAYTGFLYRHYIANMFLTLLTNILYHSTLTDMETGHKMFKADVIKKVRLKSNRFNIEPEITAKLLKGGFRVREIYIPYKGRTYEEGKKVSLRDGLAAIIALLRYRISD